MGGVGGGGQIGAFGVPEVFLLVGAEDLAFVGDEVGDVYEDLAVILLVLVFSFRRGDGGGSRGVRVRDELHDCARDDVDV